MSGLVVLRVTPVRSGGGAVDWHTETSVTFTGAVGWHTQTSVTFTGAARWKGGTGRPTLSRTKKNLLGLAEFSKTRECSSPGALGSR